MSSITVFTPTYNRAHTLRRVYVSLCNQKTLPTEWLIVNDGSTDETPLLLEELAKSAPFPIRVIHQPNGGKHRAHNAAVQVAAGELCVILDSDDELTTEALATIQTAWEAIASEDRKHFAGILGNSASQDQSLIGKQYSTEYLDGNLFELVNSGILVGEKLPTYRTDVLRQYPFPERSGCKALVPEGTVWMKIGSEYSVRCVNSVLRIYHRDPHDPLALMNSYKRPDSNAWGAMQYFAVVLTLCPKFWPRFYLTFVKAGINLTRYALHSRTPIFRAFRLIESAFGRLLWLILIPLGTFVFALDRLRMYARNLKAIIGSF